MKELTIGHLDDILRQDSGINILKSRSSAFVLTFLYNTFYVNNISSLSYDEFSQKLENFIEENQELEEELEEDIGLEGQENPTFFERKDIGQRIRAYTDIWLSDNKHYIRRFRNSNKIETIELDSATSRLLPFINRILNSDVIGTESAFNNILSQLGSLAEDMESNPQKRIEKIEREVRKLEQEKLEIQKTNKVRALDKRATIERLKDVESRAREMLADFSQVEENFRGIMGKLAQKQVELDASKRKIMGYTFELHSNLMSSSQGQSFNSFWSYMTSHREDQISVFCGEIEELLQREKIEYDNTFLVSLRKVFFDAGKKIVDKNNILTERMRRVMEQKSRRDHKGFQEIIAQIKQKGAAIKEEEQFQRTIMMEIETTPDLLFPLARNLRFAKEENVIPAILFEEQNGNKEAILSLKNEFFVDEKLLEDRICLYFKESGAISFTLYELTQRFPVEKGLEEIVCYMGLAEKWAGKGNNGAINNEQEEQILYTWKDKNYTVNLPEVRFYGK